MEALFENYPFQLTTLSDATKVIPLLLQEDFDLIFTDIQMPKKSGYVLVEKIRNHQKPEIKNIPVVALSGKRDSSPEDFIAKGFTYFVGKPVRKSTRLNSSHVKISYAVFCLKKKKKTTNNNA